MSGCLDLTGVVYFVSVTALCLFLTCQCVQKRRWSMTTKKLTTGMFSVAMIVVGFAVAVAVNMVVKEMPSSWTAVDATSTKLYSLTDTTKDYVKNLSAGRHDLCAFVREVGGQYVGGDIAAV